MASEGICLRSHNFAPFLLSTFTFAQGRSCPESPFEDLNMMGTKRLDPAARSLGLKSIRTFDRHGVTLGQSSIAPAVFYPLASDLRAQPRLWLLVYHLGFFVSAGHYSEVAGLRAQLTKH